MTIKGFNRFVWDFEGSTRVGKPENVYGTYQSHGSMLIANSEEALKAHDINNGWDWTKIPGATTMSLTLAQTSLSKARTSVHDLLLEEQKQLHKTRERPQLKNPVAPTELPGLSTVRLMGVTSMQFTLILLHTKAPLALIGKYNILMCHISYTGF